MENSHMTQSRRPLLHFYLADHKRDGTSSLGIWNVSRCLLHAMAQAPDPGWDIVVSLHPDERPLLSPPVLPPWIRLHDVRGPRLWLDHVWCPLWSWRKKVTAVFFPKGWMPAWMPRRIQSWVLLHDAMNDYYARVHPGYFPKRKTDYFRWLLWHSYRNADRVFVNSLFTAGELERACGQTRDVQVLRLADPLPPPDRLLPRNERKGILILGSTLPHKCTKQALDLLRRWREHSGFSEPILVTGAPPTDSETPEGFLYLGRLSDAALSQTYADVRALVDLSEMEGFGLPLREAYARGAPVVYRDAHAFREAMGPAAPGSWDGNEQSFESALQQVITLEDTAVHSLCEGLQATSGWQHAIAALWESMERPISLVTTETNTKEKPTKRPLLHYYMADCRWSTTSTPGGYHFSVRLLHELIRNGDFGWDLLLSIKPEERSRILPPSLPPWLQIAEIEAPRLFIDQIWSWTYSLRKGVTAIFYPKGWIPFFVPKSLKTIGVLYDCMNDHYKETYPGYIRPLKSAYFRHCTRHTLRRAQTLFTISDYSRQELQRRYATSRPIQVIPLADSLPSCKELPRDQRRGLLCLGSRHPHKRTRETLELFQDWRKSRASEETLFLTGPCDFPSELLVGVETLGRLSDTDLSRVMGSVRALLLLSDMEGFGLPLVEAYARRTPVLFRDAHSFREIMGPQAPGAWDGIHGPTFVQTLENVLNLNDADIEKIARHVFAERTWEASARIFRKQLQNLIQGEKS